MDKKTKKIRNKKHITNKKTTNSTKAIENIMNDPKTRNLKLITAVTVVVTLGSYIVPLLMNIFSLMSNIFGVFFGLISYIVMTPTYVNTFVIFAFANLHDVTWGNRQTIEDPNEKKKREKQEDEYKSYRANVLMVWLLVNVLFAYALTHITSSSGQAAFLLALSAWVAIILVVRLVGAILYKICNIFPSRMKKHMKTNKGIKTPVNLDGEIEIKNVEDIEVQVIDNTGDGGKKNAELELVGPQPLESNFVLKDNQSINRSGEEIEMERHIIEENSEELEQSLSIIEDDVLDNPIIKKKTTMADPILGHSQSASPNRKSGMSAFTAKRKTQEFPNKNKSTEESPILKKKYTVI